jgi:hypothetical protein
VKRSLLDLVDALDETFKQAFKLRSPEFPTEVSPREIAKIWRELEQIRKQQPPPQLPPTAGSPGNPPKGGPNHGKGHDHGWEEIAEGVGDVAGGVKGLVLDAEKGVVSTAKHVFDSVFHKGHPPTQAKS